MFEYTHKNHFRFGYDGHWFATPTDQHRMWQVEPGRCIRSFRRFDAECRRAVRLITQNTPDLIPNIAFSGGIDSEIIVRTFMELGIPFKITIFKYSDDLNLHDISFAISFCEEHQLDYEIRYVDVISFWNSDQFYQLADDIKCVSPKVCAYLHSFDLLEDGLLIIGQGGGRVIDLTAYEHLEGNFAHSSPRWHIVETERNNALYRYFIQRSKKAIPSFFRYTPELISSFLSDSTVRELVTGKLPGYITTQTAKYEIYKKYFPDIQPRPNFHGFERMIDEEKRLQQILTKRLPQYTRRVCVAYDEMLKHLEPYPSSRNGTSTPG
jgi:hypothetical protein